MRRAGIESLIKSDQPMRPIAKVRLGQTSERSHRARQAADIGDDKHIRLSLCEERERISQPYALRHRASYALIGKRANQPEPVLLTVALDAKRLPLCTMFFIRCGDRCVDVGDRSCRPGCHLSSPPMTAVVTYVNVHFKNKRHSVGERSVGFGRIEVDLADRQSLHGRTAGEIVSVGLFFVAFL